MQKASPALGAFIDETIRRSGEERHHPTTFIAMGQRYGTIPAISRLVQDGDVQSGFRRLHRLDLIDWTIEAAVMAFPNEFSADTRECAVFRLRLAKGETH